MSHHSRLIFLVVLALLFWSITASAQQSQQSTEAEKAAEEALRQKAFDLLYSVADQLGTLQSAENRARIGSNLVGSLWKRDEARAKTLLRLVEEDIRTELQKAANTNPKDHQSLMVFLQLRRETVERVVKHDAEIALAFLKATELPSDPPYDPQAHERAFELRLAKQIAAEKPDQALQLGRKFLAKGFSDDLLSLLSKLLTKHREHGVVLYKETVAKLRESEIREWSILPFASSLAQQFAPPDVDDSTYRDLINLFIKTAYDHGCARKDDEMQYEYMCQQLVSVLPQMQKIDPARAARLAHWRGDDREQHPTHKGVYEVEEAFESGKTEDVLDVAKKYPEMASHVRIRAIQKAQADGDLERAVKLADEFGDPDTQRYLRRQLEREREMASIDDAEVAQLINRASSAPNAREQFFALLQVAERVRKSGKQRNVRLLNQVEEMIRTLKPGEDKTQFEILVAMSYCLDKNERGLAIIESVLPKLNELIDAASKLDGYDTGYLRDGEWNMSAKGSIGKLLTGLALSAAFFARCDFDRALNLTSQFHRSEIRLMAQLKLAQGILAGRPTSVFGPMHTFH